MTGQSSSFSEALTRYYRTLKKNRGIAPIDYRGYQAQKNTLSPEQCVPLWDALFETPETQVPATMDTLCKDTEAFLCDIALLGILAAYKQAPGNVSFPEDRVSKLIEYARPDVLSITLGCLSASIIGIKKDEFGSKALWEKLLNHGAVLVQDWETSPIPSVALPIGVSGAKEKVLLLLDRHRDAKQRGKRTYTQGELNCALGEAFTEIESISCLTTSQNLTQQRKKYDDAFAEFLALCKAGANPFRCYKSYDGNYLTPVHILSEWLVYSSVLFTLDDFKTILKHTKHMAGAVAGMTNVLSHSIVYIERFLLKNLTDLEVNRQGARYVRRNVEYDLLNTLIVNGADPCRGVLMRRKPIIRALKNETILDHMLSSIESLPYRVVYALYKVIGEHENLEALKIISNHSIANHALLAVTVYHALKKGVRRNDFIHYAFKDPAVRVDVSKAIIATIVKREPLLLYAVDADEKVLKWILDLQDDDIMSKHSDVLGKALYKAASIGNFKAVRMLWDCLKVHTAEEMYKAYGQKALSGAVTGGLKIGATSKKKSYYSVIDYLVCEGVEADAQRRRVDRHAGTVHSRYRNQAVFRVLSELLTDDFSKDVSWCMKYHAYERIARKRKENPVIHDPDIAVLYNPSNKKVYFRKYAPIQGLGIIGEEEFYKVQAAYCEVYPTRINVDRIIKLLSHIRSSYRDSDIWVAAFMDVLSTDYFVDQLLACSKIFTTKSSYEAQKLAHDVFSRCTETFETLILQGRGDRLLVNDSSFVFLRIQDQDVIVGLGNPCFPVSIRHVLVQRQAMLYQEDAVYRSDKNERILFKNICAVYASRNDILDTHLFDPLFMHKIDGKSDVYIPNPLVNGGCKELKADERDALLVLQRTIVGSYEAQQQSDGSIVYTPPRIDEDIVAFRDYVAVLDKDKLPSKQQEIKTAIKMLCVDSYVVEKLACDAYRRCDKTGLALLLGSHYDTDVLFNKNKLKHLLGYKKDEHFSSVAGISQQDAALNAALKEVYATCTEKIEPFILNGVIDDDLVDTPTTFYSKDVLVSNFSLLSVAAIRRQMMMYQQNQLYQTNANKVQLCKNICDTPGFVYDFQWREWNALFMVPVPTELPGAAYVPNPWIKNVHNGLGSQRRHTLLKIQQIVASSYQAQQQIDGSVVYRQAEEDLAVLGLRAITLGIAQKTSEEEKQKERDIVLNMPVKEEVLKSFARDAYRLCNSEGLRLSLSRFDDRMLLNKDGLRHFLGHRDDAYFNNLDTPSQQAICYNEAMDEIYAHYFSRFENCILHGDIDSMLFGVDIILSVNALPSVLLQQVAVRRQAVVYQQNQLYQTDANKVQLYKNISQVFKSQHAMLHDDFNGLFIDPIQVGVPEAGYVPNPWIKNVHNGLSYQDREQLLKIQKTVTNSYEAEKQADGSVVYKQSEGYLSIVSFRKFLADLAQEASKEKQQKKIDSFAKKKLSSNLVCMLARDAYRRCDETGLKLLLGLHYPVEKLLNKEQLEQSLGHEEDPYFENMGIVSQQQVTLNNIRRIRLSSVDACNKRIEQSILGGDMDHFLMVRDDINGVLSIGKTDVLIHVDSLLFPFREALLCRQGLLYQQYPEFQSDASKLQLCKNICKMPIMYINKLRLEFAALLMKTNQVDMPETGYLPDPWIMDKDNGLEYYSRRILLTVQKTCLGAFEAEKQADGSVVYRVPESDTDVLTFRKFSADFAQESSKEIKQKKINSFAKKKLSSNLVCMLMRDAYRRCDKTGLVLLLGIHCSVELFLLDEEQLRRYLGYEVDPYFGKMSVVGQQQNMLKRALVDGSYLWKERVEASILRGDVDGYLFDENDAGEKVFCANNKMASMSLHTVVTRRQAVLYQQYPEFQSNANRLQLYKNIYCVRDNKKSDDLPYGEFGVLLIQVLGSYYRPDPWIDDPANGLSDNERDGLKVLQRSIQGSYKVVIPICEPECLLEEVGASHVLVAGAQGVNTRMTLV